ncbi:MAG: hypothetical protein LIP05_09160 [Tannerellaceae bacterium]|nr:hypothetical protein [Tannerellaceae bacterium]
MDKLKKFIDTNRKAFEDDLLPAGHFERFKKKLPKESVGRNIRIALYTLIAAASVALLFLFTLQYQESIGFNPSGQTLCEHSDQFQEVKMYYHIQMQEVLSEMEKLYQEEHIPGRKEILEETKEVITASMLFEENILPDLPCSDEGLFAMSQHYRNSLESLNLMLRHMTEIAEIDANQK